MNWLSVQFKRCNGIKTTCTVKFYEVTKFCSLAIEQLSWRPSGALPGKGGGEQEREEGFPAGCSLSGQPGGCLEWCKAAAPTVWDMCGPGT